MENDPCTLIGHNFEPRYDIEPVNSIDNKYYTHNTLQGDAKLVEAFFNKNSKKYLYDICTKCGKIIKPD